MDQQHIWSVPDILNVKKPAEAGFFVSSPAFSCVAQAAASQYPALKGLLMRSASGDTSSNLSVGMRSSPSATAAVASAARSPWPMSGERATEKNRSSETESSGPPSNQQHL